MDKKILFLFLIILFVPSVLAEEGHLSLLAVSEGNGDYKGSVADLYLEIKEGSGRVFIETFPITKFDTQLSTRFAKEIACDYFDNECDKHDFFFRIKADSSIIGGPSAGAAIAVLTSAMLNDLDVDEEISITGTINSGGLVGPVGGVKEKIKAAAESDLDMVLIPNGNRFLNEENETIDLVEYGSDIGISVEEVSSLAEVLSIYTGEDFDGFEGELEIDEEYKGTMKYLAVMLCNRSNSFASEVVDDNSSLFDGADNLTRKGKVAYSKEVYYSAASYCFGANVRYKNILLIDKNLSKKGIIKEMKILKEKIDGFENNIDERSYSTITDLETYMVVKERLMDAGDYINTSFDEEQSEIVVSGLAYANERLFSAYSWSNFFSNGGREFELSKDVMKKSCSEKLAEAEERYQYFNLFFPSSLFFSRKELDRAYDDSKKGNYELCLFKASKAKAEANVLLSGMGVEKEHLQDLIDNKLDAIKRNLIKEVSNDVFPILAYSYYEYAKTLKDSDPHSALLYAEYALELSSLNLYFKERSVDAKPSFDIKFLIVFFIGIIIGVLVVFVYIRVVFKKKNVKFRF